MSSQPEMTRQMVPSLRLLAPQLVVAGVLPVVAYAFLRPHVASDATALAAVMVFPIAEIAFERLRHGRFEPIGIIALMGIAVGLVGALAFHGDATLLKVRDSLFTGVFGLVCLGSLGARRPAMYYLGRSFATGDDPAKVREFDTIWELPGVPRRFQSVTAVWGVALVTEAVARTALALTLPTQTFLVVSPVLNWGMIAALLWFTTSYTRRSERRVVAAIETETA
jgi:hypothetical protein